MEEFWEVVVRVEIELVFELVFVYLNWEILMEKYIW